MNLELTNQLKRARDNLEKLRQDFKDDPDLLAFYEPSALYIINILEKNEETTTTSI